MSYSQFNNKILNLVRNSEHRGQLLPNAFNLHAKGTIASCGDQLEVWVFVDQFTGIVEKVGFVATGCMLSQAAAAQFCILIEGKPFVQTQLLDVDYLIGQLGVQVGPNRRQCVQLIISLWQQLK